MRRMLCISGKRFSGKDTFARFCVEAARARGVAVATWAFADQSKRMFAAQNPEVDLGRLLGDREYKEKWRPLLTRFTVESIAADPLVFVREVAAQLDDRLPIITDLRLRIELDWLKESFDLLVVRLERPDALRAASGWVFDAAKDQHQTETDLDELPLPIVKNDGSESELAKQAEATIERFVAPRSDR